MLFLNVCMTTYLSGIPIVHSWLLVDTEAMLHRWACYFLVWKRIKKQSRDYTWVTPLPQRDESRTACVSRIMIVLDGHTFSCLEYTTAGLSFLVVSAFRLSHILSMAGIFSASGSTVYTRRKC